MRVVVDTNRLESEELEIFLSARSTNLAVLPGHTLPELFKASTLDAVLSSYSVLTRFRNQVVILCSNRSASKISGATAAIANRFIDKPSTRSFPRFCSALEEVRHGDVRLAAQLRERQAWAREQVDTIEAAMGNQAEALEQISSHFLPADLRTFRTGGALSDGARQLVLALTSGIAASLARNAPVKFELERTPYRYNQFVWRYALCHVVQLIILLKDGAVQRRPDRARNDHFDNVFAVYGTYFNGIMTDDYGPMLTQGIARVILHSLGARLPEDYLDTGYPLQLIVERDTQAN